MARVLCLLVLVLVGHAANAAPAAAKSYDVWACNLPDGTDLPADGWKAQVRGAKSSAPNLCNTNLLDHDGGLQGSFAGDTVNGDYAGWYFTAPADSTITGYTLWRTARSVSSPDAFQDYIFSHELPRSFESPYLRQFCSRYVSCNQLGDDTHPFSGANRFTAGNLAVKRLYAFMQCDAQSGQTTCLASPSAAGRFTIYAARISLEDPYRPEISRAPSGTLVLTDEPLTGVKTLSVAGSDRGAGVEKAGIVIDGRQRASQLTNTGLARCRRPFRALKPCPASGEATLAFDTAQLANGAHTIQASVTDAAGNETRSDPVTVTTLNGSQPNGRGATRFVKLSAYLRSKRDKPRRTAVVPYGKTRFAEGRLTDAAGSPIAGAILQVTSRVQRPGAKARGIGTVTTSEDGRFAYRIAKGPSRTVSFGYKAYSLDPAPVSTAQVSLGVKAGIRLKVRPRRVRNGQRIRFTGRLKGGPARKGTRLTIDVLVPDARRRLPIGTVRADRSGRFRFTYRFQRTLVKARYRFQARLAAQPGYPYRGAASRRVAVVVSP